MAEKQAISSNFYSQIVIICTIASCSVIGFRYMVSEMKEAARNEIQPIVERVIILEETCKQNGFLLAENINDINATITSLDLFLAYYNKNYHKEFLRPSDIVERTQKRK